MSRPPLGAPAVIAVALMVFILGFVGRGAGAQEPNIQHPRWVIIATMVDRATGKRLQHSRLTDPELQFQDPAGCQAVLERVQPVSNEHVVVVLSCLKVPAEGENR